MVSQVTGSIQRAIRPIVLEGTLKAPTVKYIKGLEGEPVEVISINVSTLDIPEGDRYRLAAIGLDGIKCAISITPHVEQLGFEEVDIETGEIFSS